MTKTPADPYDLFDSERLKREALTTVWDNGQPWSERAFECGKMFFSDEPFAGEAIRAYVEPLIGEPHHPNAWGSLTQKLLKAGYIEPTGRFVKMRRRTSHARLTQEYRRTGKAP